MDFLSNAFVILIRLQFGESWLLNRIQMVLENAIELVDLAVQLLVAFDTLLDPCALCVQVGPDHSTCAACRLCVIDELERKVVLFEKEEAAQ